MLSYTNEDEAKIKQRDMLRRAEQERLGNSFNHSSRISFRRSVTQALAGLAYLVSPLQARRPHHEMPKRSKLATDSGIYQIR